MALALLTPDRQGVQQYPIGLRQVQQALGLTNVSMSETFEALAPYSRIVIVQPTLPPDLTFGQELVEGAPEEVDGVWQQTWTVQSIALGEAKDQLKEMAADIYMDKVMNPRPVQLRNAASGVTGVIQTRSTTLKPKYDDVYDRIDAATTAAEARAILAELEAAGG
jgi:hypothetical protein